MKKSAEFRQVYSFGRRYDSHLMTIFILQNDLSQHRLGLTASRKAIGCAVLRNRTKRVLRETFRLSESSVTTLQKTYDWVFNAKRGLLRVRTQNAIEEFNKLLERIACDEQNLLSEGSE